MSLASHVSQDILKRFEHAVLSTFVRTSNQGRFHSRSEILHVPNELYGIDLLNIVHFVTFP